MAGGGGAGMFAAVAAARNGARVMLLDKNVVGRGGATIMAQMTCASALGEAEPDNPQLHLDDTLEARARALQRRSRRAALRGQPRSASASSKPGRSIGRAADDGKINQVKAPGHSRKRCVYVDFLSTGAAICAALRNKTSRDSEHPPAEQCEPHRHRGPRDGEVDRRRRFRRADIGAGRHQVHRRSCSAPGGMTKMFKRTTASNNLAGEGVGSRCAQARG